MALGGLTKICVLENLSPKALAKLWQIGVSVDWLYRVVVQQFWGLVVVRTPGRDGRVHDHGHAWTAYGVLDGTERLECYRRIDDGKRADYALIQLESIGEGKAGKVDLVEPFAIHLAKDGAKPSVAAIVRTEGLVWRVLEGCNVKADRYHQNESSTRVPFEVT